MRGSTSDGEVILSAGQARQIALAAQQLGRPRPAGRPHLGHLRRLVGALGAVQLDAVSVLVRAHYLPGYARLGPYPRDLLDRLAYQRRTAFEYLGHAASLLPVELQPAVRWRMARYAGHRDWLRVQERIERERPGYLAAVEAEIAARGPLALSDLSDPARRERVPTRYAESTLLWYRWSDGKTALEGLFRAGRLAVAGRRGFERLYDLTERVIPPEVLAVPTPSEQDGQRELVLRAAGALGVATVKDVADYFRLPSVATRARLRELVEAGALLPARVAGWSEPAYLSPQAKPAPVPARALLSPFDSLIWERARSERLFGFRPSFELYVKPEQRRYGYYVLGFLLGEAIVARVDLKADQQRRALLVPGAFAEPGVPVRTVAGELATELRALAGWLELDTVEVGERGDLARELRRASRRNG
ncbi:MAG: winged helix-turn-helix domain-containing protein [Micromonosporaceae bacterium]|nr:winged helix-turn-helix domain-containing protein [Micromonosporaceae bacterium]